MERNYIKFINANYLRKLGFSKKQIDKVEELFHHGIQEKLYTKSRVPYHNMKHIEKVIMYAIWILNKKAKKEEFLEDQDILLWAALYHDCGRSFKAPGKKHGIVGAEIAKNKLKSILEDKTINSICLLIETHANASDEVDFKNYNYKKKEKKNIQLLSNILKDADALDRNRIELFPFAKCDINRLRTVEAKDIYYQSDLFYKKYKEAIKESRKST